VSSSTPAVFVAFDVETTGLIAGVDRVVELAAVLFSGDEIVEAFSALVNPGVSMPAVVTKVTGITDEMLSGAPAPSGPLADFLQVLRRGIPVAHNSPFDVGFVVEEARAAGLCLPDGPVLDTRGLARKAFPDRYSYSLANLVRELRLETAGAHRALADAHACRSLFRACHHVLARDGEPTVVDLARFSGAPLDFRDHAPRQPRIARIMKNAIDAGSAVAILYRSSGGETTERMIMPLSMGCVGGNPAVTAFCTLRNENRTFFLGSITEVRAP
jgi:DNA polymerase III epsilon subunit family exonuclease